MLQKKTVLVLGAGSSVEFHLPAGDGLASSIAKKTHFWFDDWGRQNDGDPQLYQAMRSRFSNGDVVVAAGRRISDGLPLARSIDDYLYNHGHDPAVVWTGKAAIVQSILGAESKSSLAKLTNPDDRSAAKALLNHSNTWIAKLFSFLQTGVRLGDVESIFDGLSIINFNYDRCVETYFFHALQRSYGIDELKAAEVMATLDITHPYGQVGHLRWQTTSSDGIAFGETAGVEKILSLTEKIKTFTEQAHDDKEKDHWREKIGESDQVLFLGFAFHRQNVELLTLVEAPARFPRGYATAYNTSHSDQKVFYSRVQDLLADSARSIRLRDVQIDNCTCNDMITQYGLEIFS